MHTHLNYEDDAIIIFNNDSYHTTAIHKNTRSSKKNSQYGCKRIVLNIPTYWIDTVHATTQQSYKATETWGNGRNKSKWLRNNRIGYFDQSNRYSFILPLCKHTNAQIQVVSEDINQNGRETIVLCISIGRIEIHSCYHSIILQTHKDTRSRTKYSIWLRKHRAEYCDKSYPYSFILPLYNYRMTQRHAVSE